MKNDVDFIAHSFVRSARDIKAVQDILDAHGSKIKIISKIENREGLDNIDEIIEASYGIMAVSYTHLDVYKRQARASPS